MVRGQGLLLMETALQVTFEQMALVTGSLPVPHRSFLPTSQPYSEQVAEVFGKFIEKWPVAVYIAFTSSGLTKFDFLKGLALHHV